MGRRARPFEKQLINAVPPPSAVGVYLGGADHLPESFHGFLLGENVPGGLVKSPMKWSADVRPPWGKLSSRHQAELVICDHPIDITYVPTREGWLYLAVVED